MARKASDLFTLLQSRGSGRGASGRSGSGIFGQMTGWLSGLSGHRRRRYEGGRRAMQFSGIALCAIVFASAGVGYLLGDTFPLGGKGAALRSQGRQEPQGVAPQVLGAASLDRFRLPADKESDSLSEDCYVVANYGEGDKARAQAADLALLLRSQGIDAARPYHYWDQHLWWTVVYYKGSDQADEVRKKLVQVPELPGHPEFAEARTRMQNQRKDWPPAMQVP